MVAQSSHKVGDTVACKRCKKEFEVAEHKFSQVFRDDCKYIKDHEYDKEYYNLYRKTGNKNGRPKCIKTVL